MEVQFLSRDTVHPQKYGLGMGGSETSLYQVARYLSLLGHKIRVVANLGTYPEGEYDGVLYTKSVARTCDVLVYFRGSFPLTEPVICSKKIWWSTDAYLVGDNWNELWKIVDYGVCISQFHLNDLINRYGLNTLPPMSVIPLGCDYRERLHTAKIKNRLIYSSEPARGLIELLQRWPLIIAAIPDATLDITFDYRLWNSTPKIGHYSIYAQQPGVNYHGLVDRKELLRLQSQADLHVYPCNHPENFCLASLECQLQGTPTVTTSIGSLPTTVNGGGICLSSYDDVVSKAIHLLRNRDELEALQARAQQHAQSMGWEKSAIEWDKLLRQ